MSDKDQARDKAAYERCVRDGYMFPNAPRTQPFKKLTTARKDNEKLFLGGILTRKGDIIAEKDVTDDMRAALRHACRLPKGHGAR